MTKTEIEADRYRVLGFLISQGASERGEKYKWTATGIRRYLGWGTVRTARALDLSWIAGDVENCTSSEGLTYYVTEQGLETYRAARERPELAVPGEAAWREEALRGMTAKGEETKIENAAIPKRSRKPRQPRQRKTECHA